MPAYEVNFDGLIGPTHNYSGLSYGNVASAKHKLSVSNPKDAALQGLAKMQFLASLGLKQAVLPPHERPHIATLRRLGFDGTDARVLENAFHDDPLLLAAACSSSNMWAANAATVSPSADTADRRVHFTPANLITQFHRSIEPATTTRILRAIFSDEEHFVVHEPLPSAAHFSDEGAANHTRLCRAYDCPGVEIFTFGRVALDPSKPSPKKFPARQTLEACQAIARRHGLDAQRTLCYQQNCDAIDAGVFHNDVVAVGNRGLFFFHQHAIAEKEPTLDQLRKMFAQVCGAELRTIEVPASAVSVEEAVGTYLFNSQLVTLPDGATALIAPTECRDHPRVRAYIDEHLSKQIEHVHFVDVRQSMQNGGGPACLRLRVVLNEEEFGCIHRGVLLDEALLHKLRVWIEKHYRDRLEFNELRDPKLLDESRTALDELTKILALPSIYDFQLH